MSDKNISPPELKALRRQIRKDMIIDLVGNLLLAVGIWGWFHSQNNAAPWSWEDWRSAVQHPYVFIPLTATGVLNLVHLPARLRRMRDWQQHKPD